MNKLLLDFGSTWCHQGSWIHLHFILAKWEEIRVGPLQSSSPKPSKLSEHETKNQTWKSHIYVAFRVIICSRLNSLRHQGKYCKIQNDKLEKYFGGKQFEKAFIPFPFHPLSSRGEFVFWEPCYQRAPLLNHTCKVGQFWHRLNIIVRVFFFLATNSARTHLPLPQTMTRSRWFAARKWESPLHLVCRKLLNQRKQLHPFGGGCRQRGILGTYLF